MIRFTDENYKQIIARLEELTDALQFTNYANALAIATELKDLLEQAEQVPTHKTKGGAWII